MALFTDGIISSVSDLKAYESSILAVANTECIDLARKLELAQREVGLELSAYLVQRGVMLDRERGLSNVVVTEPVMHWHAMQSLALVYRDAYNSQMNDRYRGKWEEFQRLSAKAQRVLQDIGVGLTSGPIERAPAPALGSVAGSMLPATTYFVRIAWLGNGNVTGAWSDAAVVSVDPGMRVTALIPAGTTWTQAMAGLRTDLGAIRVQGADYYVANRREMLRG